MNGFGEFRALGFRLSVARFPGWNPRNPES